MRPERGSPRRTARTRKGGDPPKESCWPGAASGWSRAVAVAASEAKGGRSPPPSATGAATLSCTQSVVTADQARVRPP